jgi:hypothetical protein
MYVGGREMNINDMLSPGEKILFGGKQKRYVPGGKDIAPGTIAVTTERVIIQTNKWLGLKNEFEDLHYSDIMGMQFKKNIWSSELIIKSRFQGEIHLGGIDKKGAMEMQRIINEGINRYRYGYGGPHFDRGGGGLERV